MNGMNVEVRDAVKAALERKGLTQAELARQVGMERGNLNRLISGTSGKVPDNWQRILDALDLELVAIPKKRE